MRVLRVKWLSEQYVVDVDMQKLDCVVEVGRLLARHFYGVTDLVGWVWHLDRNFKAQLGYLILRLHIGLVDHDPYSLLNADHDVLVEVKLVQNSQSQNELNRGFIREL